MKTINFFSLFLFIILISACAKEESIVQSEIQEYINKGILHEVKVDTFTSKNLRVIEVKSLEEMMQIVKAHDSRKPQKIDHKFIKKLPLNHVENLQSRTCNLSGRYSFNPWGPGTSVTIDISLSPNSSYANWNHDYSYSWGYFDYIFSSNYPFTEKYYQYSDAGLYSYYSSSGSLYNNSPFSLVRNVQLHYAYKYFDQVLYTSSHYYTLNFSAYGCDWDISL